MSDVTILLQLDNATFLEVLGEGCFKEWREVD